MIRIAILLCLLAGPAWADPTWFWRAEGTTLDSTDDLPNDMGSITLNAEASISETAALVGSYGLWTNGLLHQGRADATSTVFDPNEGLLAFLLRITQWAGGQTIALIGPSSSNQYGVKLEGLNGSGNMACFVGDADSPPARAVTTVNSLSQDVTYGVICRWDAAAGTLRIEVYSNPTGTPSLIQGVSYTSGYTAPSSLAGEGALKLGDASGLGFTGYFDNVFAAKDFDEPIQDNFAITSFTQYGEGGSESSALPKIIQQLEH
jgi:hypothetical protein